MAEDNGEITRVVAPEADKQVVDLIANINKLEAAFIEATKRAIELNKATGNSTTNGAFTRAADESNKATRIVVDNTEKQRLAEIKLQQAREKAFDDYEKKLAQQQLSRDRAAANEDKRVAKEIATQQRLVSQSEKAAASDERRIQRQQQIQDRAAANNSKRAAKELADSQRQQAQSARLAAQQEREAAKAAKDAEAYQLLVKAYNDATRAARNAGAQFGTTSTQFATTSAEANRLRTQLDGINQPLGNFQANVGNYGSAFSKLYGYIRTLANILPGLGISGIFLLLFEGLKLLTEYLGIFSDKLSLAQKNYKNLIDVSKEAAKQYGDESTKLRILYNAAVDVTNSTHNRILAARELQKEFPDTFRNIKTETILNGDASKSYEQLTKDILVNAKARAAASKISELASSQLEEDFKQERIRTAEKAESDRVTATTQIRRGDGEIDLLSPQRQLESINNQRKVIHNRAVLSIEESNQRKKELQSQIDFLTAYAGGNNKIAAALSTDNTPKEKAPDNRKQILDQQLKDARLNEEAILNNEKSTLDQRMDAISNYQKVTGDIIKKGQDAQVLTALEASNRRKDITNDTVKQIQKVESDAQKALIDLLKNGEKQQEALLAQDIIDFKDGQDAKLLEIEKYKSDALEAYADLYVSGKISAAEYNQAIYDIDNQSSKERIQVQIDTIQRIINLQKSLLEFGIGSARDIQKNQDTLTKLQIDASNLETKIKLDNIKKVQDARKEQGRLEKELANASIDFIKQIVEGGYQRQLDALQEQSDKINENAEVEKQAVANSLTTADDKARKTKIIDAQTASSQKQLADQEKKIKKEQAVFDKAISIVKIVEATGIAEVQALTYLSNPFTAPLYPAIAALIAGIGALQLATVIAQPLPKFKKGTTNAPGGLAVVGDGGMELVKQPDGLTYLTPNRDTVVDLPKGSTVVPHLQTMKLLTQGITQDTDGKIIDLREVADLLKENNRLQKQIAGKNSKTTVNGWRNELMLSANWKSYSDNHFK